MRFTEQILSGVILLFTATSAEPSIQKGRFTVTQEPISFPKKNPAIDPINTYRKYSEVTSEYKAATAAYTKRNLASVAANPTFGDKSYVSAVNIGNQTLSLVFSTGTSASWVFSSLLSTDDQACHRDKIFYPSPTTKFNKTQTFNITNGNDWWVRGVVATDDINLGNPDGANVPAQPFGLATSLGPAFKDFPADGVLGLGFDSPSQLTPALQKSFFSNIKHSLDSPLFTASLKHNASGIWNFGFIDPGDVTEPITYVDIDPKCGLWMVNVTLSSEGPNFQAVLDSGNPFIYAPTQVVSNFYSPVASAHQNSSGWFFPCDADDLPLLELDVGGSGGNGGNYPAIIPGSSFTLNEDNQTTELCVGALQESPPGARGILGGPFFKALFIVFEAKDNVHPRLGFAPQNT